MNNKVTPKSLEFWNNFLPQWGVKLSKLETTITDPRLEIKFTDIFRKFFVHPKLFELFCYPGVAISDYSVNNVYGTHGFHFLRLLTCVNFLKNHNPDTEYEHISCYYQDGKIVPTVGQTRVLFWNMIQYPGKIRAYVASHKDSVQQDFKPARLKDMLQTQHIWIRNDNDFRGVVPYCYDRDRDLDAWETEKLEIFSNIIDFFASNKLYFNTDVSDIFPCLVPFLTDNADDASVIINVYNQEKIQDAMIYAFAGLSCENKNYSVWIKNDT
jgi:hypothetical protein